MFNEIQRHTLKNVSSSVHSENGGSEWQVVAEKLNKDAVYRMATPKEKDYFINDGGSLFLLVKTRGAKRRHFVFSFDGKRNRVSLDICVASLWKLPDASSKRLERIIAGGIKPTGL
ncbi:Arm DNA-binding domain-containing protein [Methylomonas sp. CM2]|uniref:Arm DNA-binding domain-containing protein n=1 Tax=Methylomonas sp. CM2 TaxID=3417647 RepID=UPI003CEC25BE